VGVELDAWTLEEYAPLRAGVAKRLMRSGLPEPPQNIFLFHGDSTDEAVHAKIQENTGMAFHDFDLFYTYLVMHEEFAEIIRKKARSGAIFMVYGLEKVMPRYPGFRLLEDLSPLEGILALYKKA
jgi:hypothetical protein